LRRIGPDKRHAERRTAIASFVVLGRYRVEIGASLPIPVAVKAIAPPAGVRTRGSR
jgi:hypothetical protein